MVGKRKKYRVAAIIQARMGSTRLPGKVMMDLFGKTVLSRVIERTKCARVLDDICVATSTSKADDVIAEEASRNKVRVYRGSEVNVLDRYCKSASLMKADYVVRVTGDNPLTEPRFIDSCVKKIVSGNFDYVTMKNVPYGSNVEAVSVKSLFCVAKKAKKSEREHVTVRIYNNPDLFNIHFMKPKPGLKRPDIRVTLDTMNDYVSLRRIFNNFRNRPTKRIKLESVIGFIGKNKKRDF